MRRKAPCGIAFDLDGVLWRSPNVFPFAKASITKVIENQIPFIFLTNGGGYPEKEKMRHINEKLEMDLDHERLIQCHTPLRDWHHIKEQVVLVSGNRDIYKVPLEYGFKHAISTGEVITSHPMAWPFDSPHKTMPLDENRKHNPHVIDFDPSKVAAVCIMNDGLCWGSELQIMMDALLHGVKQPGGDNPLFVLTNPDLIWTTAYHRPRFAQGIYSGIVMDTYRRLTGKPLNAVTYGKPTKATFDYAETVLLNEAQKLNYDGVDEVYMIGDNPSGDIVGGNSKGWNTVLLKTGVYQEGMDPQNPTVILENVQEAIDWILARHSL